MLVKKRKKRNLMKKKYLGTKEHQIFVACPSWLRKRILRNMQKAALNRFNKARADKALELLSAINAESNAGDSQMTDNASAAEISTVTDITPQNLVAKIRTFAGNAINKCVNGITVFRKWKKYFRLVQN